MIEYQVLLAAILATGPSSAMLFPWLFGLCFLPRSTPAVGSFDSFSTWEELRHALFRWKDTDAKRQLLNRYGKLKAWNVSAIRNMSGLFRDLEDFDEDIGHWDTSAVDVLSQDMSYMFYFSQVI